jgi:mannose-1-phosphate guanylyltransferase
LERGCLWNSFVMVGRVSAFLKLIGRAAPELAARFDAILPALTTPEEEERVASELYTQLGDVNFSQQVLAASPGSLAVLRVSGLTWSDMGQPERVLSMMADVGLRPPPLRLRSLAAAKAVAG